MLEFCNNEIDYIASTKIDSDDIISELFIDLVQQEINKHDNISGKFIVFLRGLIYYHNKGYFQTVINEGSHFNTYLSKLNNNKVGNAFEYNHSFVELKFNNIVIDFDELPMWIEVRHNYNVMNGLVDKKNTDNFKKEKISSFNIQLSNEEL